MTPRNKSSHMAQQATSKKGGFGETIRTVVYAVVIALFIRTFAYEPFSIPSGSMIPTLLVGDYLFVSKFSYGYSRYSLPFSPPLFEGRILNDQPERGDVVVFKLPSDGATDYIKRVIGLPGDRVQMLNGVLHINGEAVERESLGRLGIGRQAVTVVRETLPNGSTHIIHERGNTGFYDNTQVFNVPEGHYFMMGDNRDASQDSRSSRVGYIPYDHLIGEAQFLFFSHDSSARMWEFWLWPQSIRYGRIFDGIR